MVASVATVNPVDVETSLHAAMHKSLALPIMGGYADYMIASSKALALIPDQLSATDAAPLMCAGVTTLFETAVQE